VGDNLPLRINENKNHKARTITQKKWLTGNYLKHLKLINTNTNTYIEKWKREISRPPVKINKLIKSDLRGISKRNGFGWKGGKSNGTTFSASCFPYAACLGRSSLTGPEKPTHVDSPRSKKINKKRVQLQTWSHRQPT